MKENFLVLGLRFYQIIFKCKENLNFSNTVKKIKLIQIGYPDFRTNLRSFRVIFLVFRTISHYLTSKTEFGPGLEQFQQIRTILRFLDPI